MAPCDSAVGASVVGLNLKALLLWQRHFLGVESLEVGHLAVEACEVNQSIYLICEQNRLLFVNTLLVGAHLDKEVGAAYLASRLTHLWFIVISSTASALAMLALLTCAHGNLYCV